MGKYTNRYIPQIVNTISLEENSAGFILRTFDEIGQIKFKNGVFEFIKEDDVILRFDEFGISGVINTLPDQTGHSGKFLKTDTNVAQWSTLGYANISNFNTGVEANSTVIGLVEKKHDPVTVSNSSNVTLSISGQEITADLSNTAVTPATYPYASVSVDQKGRITGIAAGDSPPTILGNSSSGYLVNAIAITSIGTTDTPVRITFRDSVSFPATTYLLTLRCYDSGGNNVDYRIAEKFSTGFDIVVPVVCTCEAMAIFYED